MSKELSNQEILEKAIKKAIDGGWANWYKEPIKSVEYDGKSVWINTGKKNVIAVSVGEVFSLIFNHEFAKALWGERHNVNNNPREQIDNYGWQYHLQQMVIADDPVKYLKENI